MIWWIKILRIWFGFFPTSARELAQTVISLLRIPRTVLFENFGRLTFITQPFFPEKWSLEPGIRKSVDEWIAGGTEKFTNDLHSTTQSTESWSQLRQCCPRVAASPYRPNSPITQLSPSMTPRLGTTVSLTTDQQHNGISLKFFVWTLIMLQSTYFVSLIGKRDDIY